MLKHLVALQVALANAVDDLRNREDGQTMAEYGVVLAVIAVGIIVALTALSGGITNALNKVTAVVGA